MNALIPVPPRRRTLQLRPIVIAILTWIAADSLAGLFLLAVGAVLIVRSGKSFPEAVKLLPHDPVFTTMSAIVGAVIATMIILRFLRRNR